MTTYTGLFSRTQCSLPAAAVPRNYSAVIVWASRGLFTTAELRHVLIRPNTFPLLNARGSH